MEYPEADFDLDTLHFAVSHRPTGTVFRFDGCPDPFTGNEVRVSFPGDMDEEELFAICHAAGLHLKARLDRQRS